MNFCKMLFHFSDTSVYSMQPPKQELLMYHIQFALYLTTQNTNCSMIIQIQKRVITILNKMQKQALNSFYTQLLTC